MKEALLMTVTSFTSVITVTTGPIPLPTATLTLAPAPFAITQKL